LKRLRQAIGGVVHCIYLSKVHSSVGDALADEVKANFNVLRLRMEDGILRQL
jgi:hypothetical protein